MHIFPLRQFSAGYSTPPDGIFPHQISTLRCFDSVELFSVKRCSSVVVCERVNSYPSPAFRFHFHFIPKLVKSLLFLSSNSTPVFYCSELDSAPSAARYERRSTLNNGLDNVRFGEKRSKTLAGNVRLSEGKCP